MVKKRTPVVLCAALIAAMITGCVPQSNISSGAGAKDYPVTIGDVTIRSEPTGAVVLTPNAASVVLTLGYETQLKAKSQACTQSDLSVLPNVTADSADQIKSLGANLVLTDTALTDSQKSAMDKDGITVLVLKKAQSREDLSRLYSQVGGALRGASTGAGKGKTMAQGLFQTIDDITRQVPQSNKPVTAVYLYDAQGSAATGDTLQGKLIEAAGLTNVAQGGTGGKIKTADVVIANPQYVFCAKGVKEQIMDSADYKKLAAVQKGKVYEMDPDLMVLQGEELVDAVSFMAGTAYPELLQSTSSASGTSSSASSGSAPMNLNQTLQKGANSNDVLTMQKRLQELGYMFVTPNGVFGDGTEQSVKDFQYLNGMQATGVADPQTLQKLFSSDPKKRVN